MDPIKHQSISILFSSTCHDGQRHQLPCVPPWSVLTPLTAHCPHTLWTHTVHIHGYALCVILSGCIRTVLCCLQCHPDAVLRPQRHLPGRFPEALLFPTGLPLPDVWVRDDQTPATHHPRAGRPPHQRPAAGHSHSSLQRRHLHLAGLQTLHTSMGDNTYIA